VPVCSGTKRGTGSCMFGSSCSYAGATAQLLLLQQQLMHLQWRHALVQARGPAADAAGVVAWRVQLHIGRRGWSRPALTGLAAWRASSANHTLEGSVLRPARGCSSHACLLVCSSLGRRVCSKGPHACWRCGRQLWCAAAPACACAVAASAIPCQPHSSSSTPACVTVCWTGGHVLVSAAAARRRRLPVAQGSAALPPPEDKRCLAVAPCARSAIRGGWCGACSSRVVLACAAARGSLPVPAGAAVCVCVPLPPRCCWLQELGCAGVPVC
jgi:hypothetical protein